MVIARAKPTASRVTSAADSARWAMRNPTIYCRPPMRAVDTIRANRDGEALSREAIESFVRGVTDGSWEDYQSSALLMAIILKGMNAVETGWLTDAMGGCGEGVNPASLPRDT